MLYSASVVTMCPTSRVAQAPYRNLKPEPSEPFPRNRNHPPMLNFAEAQKNTPPQKNSRNRKPEPLEPNRRHPVLVSLPLFVWSQFKGLAIWPNTLSLAFFWSSGAMCHSEPLPSEYSERTQRGSWQRQQGESFPKENGCLEGLVGSFLENFSSF